MRLTVRQYKGDPWLVGQATGRQWVRGQFVPVTYKTATRIDEIPDARTSVGCKCSSRSPMTGLPEPLAIVGTSPPVPGGAEMAQWWRQKLGAWSAKVKEAIALAMRHPLTLVLTLGTVIMVPKFAATIVSAYLGMRLGLWLADDSEGESAPQVADESDDDESESWSDKIRRWFGR